MKIRPRFADILLVLGVLVLVAWTPVYFAQGEEERALADGETFALRDPRDGDRMELEIVLQRNGEPAVTTGAVMTVGFRRPLADECPSGTHVVEEREVRAASIDLGPARLVTDAMHQRLCFSRDRQVLWADLVDNDRHRRGDQAVPGAEGDPIRYHEYGPLGRHQMGTRLLSFDPPQVLEYQPKSPLTSVFEYFSGTSDGGDDGAPNMEGVRAPSDEERRRLPLAALHHGRVYYAHLVQERTFTQTVTLEELLGPEQLYGPGLALGFHEFGVGIEWTEPIHWQVSEKSWKWLHPDFPVAVGRHLSVNANNDTVKIQLDLVPKTLVVGGEPLRLEPYVYEPDEWWRTDPVAPDGTELLRQDRLRKDGGLLVGGVSVAGLDDALRGDLSPADVRSFMDVGGWIQGFSWTVRPDDINVTWRVALLDDVGRRMATEVVTAAGVPLAIRGLCGVERFVDASVPYRIDCGTSEIMPGEADFAFPPSTAYARLRADYVAPSNATEVGIYLPRWHVATPVGDEWDVESVDAALAPELLLWHRLPAPGHLLLLSFSDERGRQGGLALDDGRVLLVSEADLADDATAYGLNHDVQAADSVAAIKELSPTGKTAAYGGLLLVVAWLWARFLAFVKGGGALPVVATLYAKIAKDNALDNERRALLTALIEQDPGIPLAEAARRADLHRTVAFHHLDMLRRNALVKEVRLGRTRHYVPVGRGQREALRLAARHHDAWRAVLEEVERKPGRSLSELAADLGRNKSRVSRIGHKLAAEGLVRREQAGRRVVLYPTAE